MCLLMQASGKSLLLTKVTHFTKISDSQSYLMVTLCWDIELMGTSQVGRDGLGLLASLGDG